MVNDTLLLDNDSVVLVVYLVLILEILRMSCMSAPLFNIRLIYLDVPDLAEPVIGSASQLYDSH